MPKGFHFGRTQQRHYISEYHRINAALFKSLMNCPTGTYSFNKDGVSAEHCKFKLVKTAKWLRVMIFNINEKEIPIPLQTDNRSASKKTYLICPYCLNQRQHLYATRSTYACRACLNLHYASQSEREPSRLARSIRKQRSQLWGHSFPDANNLFESCEWLPKPKWHRWSSFERKKSNIIKMEKQYWKLSMSKLNGVLAEDLGYLLDFD